MTRLSMKTKKDGNAVRSAAAYWQSDNEATRAVSHWLGHGRFDDQSAWEMVGRSNYVRYLHLARLCEPGPVRSMVEWGSGGGANAVEFTAKLRLERFYGVDVTVANVAECERQLAVRGLSDAFRPVLIPVERPETVLEQVESPVDFFLSTTVYQFFPSASYGLEVTRLAWQLLRPGGTALIHTRYGPTPPPGQDYADNPAFQTIYGIDDFWTSVEECGFEPLGVTLDCQRLSAYYFLRKPEPTP